MSAKSKRDDKPVFEFPEFDKEEYIEKEFRDAKTSRVVIVLAFIIAIASYGLIRINESYRIIGLLLIFLAVAGLKDFFHAIKIDTSAFEKKNWIGNSLLLFFAWFGIFTLLLNPPFYDMIDPKIESIDLYTIANETADNITFLRDDSPSFNSNISINATVADNNKVENVTLLLTYPDKRTETIFMWETGNENDEYTGGFLKLSQEGTYTFKVLAEDRSGNNGEYSRSITIKS